MSSYAYAVDAHDGNVNAVNLNVDDDKCFCLLGS